MLARCTNTLCSAGFRYLHEGKLFRLEIDPTVRSSKGKREEYFWLCSPCSAAMTLRLCQDGKVIPTALQETVYKESHVAFIAANRESGLLLRSVSFLRSSTSRDDT